MNTGANSRDVSWQRLRGHNRWLSGDDGVDCRLGWLLGDNGWLSSHNAERVGASKESGLGVGIDRGLVRHC